MCLVALNFENEDNLIRNMNNQEEILPVSISQYVKDIVAGSFHSIAICHGGIFVWGKADLCNLGLDSK